jgi:gamma-glutamyltranspeptidase / glutathione hydrolase
MDRLTAPELPPASITPLASPKEHPATLYKRVQPNGPAFTPAPTVNLKRDADTIYLTTADRWGNMVSWANSNFTLLGTA